MGAFIIIIIVRVHSSNPKSQNSLRSEVLLKRNGLFQASFKTLKVKHEKPNPYGRCSNNANINQSVSCATVSKTWVCVDGVRMHPSHVQRSWLCTSTDSPTQKPATREGLLPS